MTSPKLAVTTANGRYYHHPRRARDVPSITNVMNMKSKPALRYWAAREAATYAAQNLDKLQPLSETERVQLIKTAPFGKSAASSVGDTVHDWIDRIIKGETVPDTEIQAAPITARRMLETFYAFCRKHQPTFNEAEFTVWSEKIWLCGNC